LANFSGAAGSANRNHNIIKAGNDTTQSLLLQLQEVDDQTERGKKVNVWYLLNL